MDGPKDYHSKWSKPDKDKYRPYVESKKKYVETKKIKKKKTLFTKTEIDLQT